MHLTESQRQAVEHTSGNCKVVATAGSGKTTALVTRAQRLATNNSNYQLCLSFTKAAALNMKTRSKLDESSALFRTFHGMCFNFLKKSPDGPSATHRLIAPQETWMMDQWAEKVAEVVTLTAKEVFSAFTIAQASGIMPELWAEGISGMSEEESFSAAMLHKKLQSNGRMTFGDLQIETLRYMRTHPESLVPIKERITHIMVDEFQDTDPVQMLLLKEMYRGDNLFVVGDPAQSLYSWRGAKMSIMMDFEQHFGSHDTIILETNFRSQAGIVAVADKLIKNSLECDDYDVVAHRPKGAKVTTKVFEREGEESEWVAADIQKKLSAGAEPRDIAILYRTNAYAGPFEMDLVSRNIPYQNADQSEGFFGMAEIKALLSYLRVGLNPTDLTALRYLWNKPNRFMANKLLAEAVSHDCGDAYSIIQYIIKKRTTKKTTVATLQQLQATLLNLRNSMAQPPASALRSLLSTLNYRQYLHAKAAQPSGRDYATQLAAVTKLIETVAIKSSSTKQFLSYVERTIEENQAKKESPNAVTLSTIHRAKGLEYPHVYVVGFSDEIMPHANSTNIEEERRIAFVALTRAEDFLTLSCSGKPSRFFQEMGLQQYSTHDPVNH